MALQRNHEEMAEGKTLSMAWGTTQDPYGGANDGRADTRQKKCVEKRAGPPQTPVEH